MNPSVISGTSMEETLDAEISSIRAEIRKLQKRRRVLCASVLSSTLVQTQLRSRNLSRSSDISPLIQSIGTHAATNHHRIAFSATSFPFKDPDPNPTPDTSPNLLGVRIDICDRNGRYVQPYYILLRKTTSGGENRLHVHRHTIPAFIPLDKFAQAYLPRLLSHESTGEGGVVEKPWKSGARRKQDLRGFVREVRKELVAWHLRKDAIDLAKERLGLPGDYHDEKPQEEERLADSLGIASLSSTALDAKHLRLRWKDGRLGLLKISNTGAIDRAVVMDGSGRNKELELTLTASGGRVESLASRLTQRTAAK